MKARKSADPATEFRLDGFLPYKLVVVTELVSRVFAENIGAAFKLTRPEWRVLAAIVELGKASPSHVGHRASMAKVKVSRAVQGLIAKGLVRRTPDPDDGRSFLLRLTRKGADTHARLVPLGQKTEAKVFENLSGADKAALERILAKITAGLETIP